MRNKFSILFLAFNFFVSTTALPVFDHTCSMRNNSSEECSNCSSENTGKYFNETRKTEIIEEEPISGCCLIKVIDNAVKDNYILISSKQDENQLTVVPFPEGLLTCSYNKYTVGYYQPARLQYESNELYLFNSILLI